MSEPTRREVPPGTAGEGQEDYPTYHDRPGDTRAPVERRRRGRTWIPIFIGVVIFALILIVRLVWSGAQTIESGEAIPETPAVTDTTETPTPAPGETASEASESGLDQDVEVDTRTGPGEVPDTPGAIDVPGGDVTDPVETPQAEPLPGGSGTQ